MVVVLFLLLANRTGHGIKRILIFPLMDIKRNCLHNIWDCDCRIPDILCVIIVALANLRFIKHRLATRMDLLALSLLLGCFLIIAPTCHLEVPDEGNRKRIGNCSRNNKHEIGKLTEEDDEIPWNILEKIVPQLFGG